MIMTSKHVSQSLQKCSSKDYTDYVFNLKLYNLKCVSCDSVSSATWGILLLPLDPSEKFKSGNLKSKKTWQWGHLCWSAGVKLGDSYFPFSVVHSQLTPGKIQHFRNSCVITIEALWVDRWLPCQMQPCTACTCARTPSASTRTQWTPPCSQWSERRQKVFQRLVTVERSQRRRTYWIGFSRLALLQLSLKSSCSLILQVYIQQSRWIFNPKKWFSKYQVCQLWRNYKYLNKYLNK